MGWSLSGFVYLDSISRDDIFVRMPRADLSALKPPMSRVVGPLEVLTRSFHPFHTRICIYFNVPGPRLADHCRTQFPMDFYRSCAEIEANFFIPVCNTGRNS